MCARSSNFPHIASKEGAPLLVQKGHRDRGHQQMGLGGGCSRLRGWHAEVGWACPRWAAQGGVALRPGGGDDRGLLGACVESHAQVSAAEGSW